MAASKTTTMSLDAAQQRLVENNLALVRKVIKDRVYGIQNIGIFTYEDLYQIGCMGLCKAAYTDKFQYAYKRENTHTASNTCFSTYAYRVILNEILTKLEYATRRRAEVVTAPEKMAFFSSTHQSSAEEQIAVIELEASVGKIFADAMNAATGVTAKGIQALLYTMDGYTSTEIAKIMGATTGNHVTAWIAKARKYLQSDPELIRLLKTV